MQLGRLGKQSTSAGGSGQQEVVGALLLRQATSPHGPGKCLRIWEIAWGPRPMGPGNQDCLAEP